MSGKGDSPRPVDKARYDSNYERIRWSPRDGPDTFRTRNGIRESKKQKRMPCPHEFESDDRRENRLDYEDDVKQWMTED